MVLAQKQTYGSLGLNREPRNKPTHLQLIFNKGGKTIQWRKDSLFSEWCWKSWTASYKSTKLEHTITSYTKINSKCFKDLNIRHDTTKLLEESTSKKFSDINRSNVILDQSLKVIEIKACLCFLKN